MASSTRNILFLTNSELGQCNVALAVAEEFLRKGDYQVHFASFAPVADEVNNLHKRAGCENTAQFHQIPSPCMTDLAIRSCVGLLFHKPGVKGAIQGFAKVGRAMESWRPSEYKQAFDACLRILDELQPEMVVVDPILHVGIDACHAAKARFTVLWPVPIKDVVVVIQPKAAVLWKYPVTGSGFPFPVPWKLVLRNMYLIFRAIMTLAFGKPVPDEIKDGKKPEGRNPFPLPSAYEKDALQLTPAFPELDFPFEIPDNVISCGPILRKCRPLPEADPEMDSWLQRPTILISLGSHVKPTEKIAVDMAKGIAAVLTKQPDVQVLWKLRYDWESSKAFQKVLRPLMTAGSVKVVSWIKADIMSVLETGRIISYVHHGGANSYFEACKVGVPQVVLPQWLDTYDCATRVEWLGIGVNGSKKAAPGIDTAEFSKALLHVLSDDDIRHKSAAVKRMCEKTEGRVVAHDQIVEFCSAKKL